MQNDLKTLGNRFLGRDLNFLKNDKIECGKICLRFWDILGFQVQNDLKTLGNRFWGRGLNFLENDKNGTGKKLVTLLGHFGMSGAE